MVRNRDPIEWTITLNDAQRVPLVIVRLNSNRLPARKPVRVLMPQTRSADVRVKRQRGVNVSVPEQRLSKRVVGITGLLDAIVADEWLADVGLVDGRDGAPCAFSRTRGRLPP